MTGPNPNFPLNPDFVISLQAARSTVASDGNASTICINSILPDEILEEILSKLPLTSIIRGRLVCKSWNRLLRSASFLHELSSSPPSSQKSWYYSLRCGKAYDLSVHSWRNFQFLSSTPEPFSPHYSEVAFSPGLLCVMACKLNGLEFYVCNPITRLLRKLPDLPWRRQQPNNYTVALSMSAGRVPGTYIIVAIISEDTFVNIEDGTQVGIHVYCSEKMAWETRVDAFLPIECDSRQQSSVICDEALYFQCRNCATDAKFVCAYDLFSGSDLDTPSFEGNLIAMPHAKERFYLMNMKGKVVMVGLSKESTKVRLLDGKEWVEVAAMPKEYIERLNNTFVCVSGFDEIIYIHDMLSERLVIFEMATGGWRWIEVLYCVTRGTYFEPRFDVIP